MKKLIFLGVEYEAERIVKDMDSIIGYTGTEKVFGFDGVSDFSLFELADGQTFDAAEMTIEQKLAQQDVTILALMDVIVSLKGGAN